MPKKKAAAPSLKRMEIPIQIYRCHLILFFGATLKEMSSFGKRRGVPITRSWERRIESLLDEPPGCNGFCAEYGEDNRDVLIWLQKFPQKATEYGVLYHEIYHAVDMIAFGIDPSSRLTDASGLSEAKAFLFEYIANTINKILWSVT